MKIYFVSAVSLMAAIIPARPSDPGDQTVNQSYNIRVNRGHLITDWQINEVNAKVFLETAFPKIVFDESFVAAHNEFLKLDLQPAPETMTIAFWGAKDKLKVLYTIDDSVNINGVKMRIDALVVDISKNSSVARDVIFPVDLLNCVVEFDIRKRQMKMSGPEDYSLEGAAVYDMSFDSTDRKRLYYIDNVLICCSRKDTARIRGAFLLDIGAANALNFNKLNPRIPPFLKNAAKTQSKSLRIYDSGNLTNVTVVNPAALYFDEFFLKGMHIAAFNMYMREQEKFVGILGVPFFERFTVGFDFINKKLYLKQK